MFESLFLTGGSGVQAPALILPRKQDGCQNQESPPKESIISIFGLRIWFQLCYTGDLRVSAGSSSAQVLVNLLPNLIFSSG